MLFRQFNVFFALFQLGICRFILQLLQCQCSFNEFFVDQYHQKIEIIIIEKFDKQTKIIRQILNDYFQRTRHKMFVNINTIRDIFQNDQFENQVCIFHQHNQNKQIANDLIKIENSRLF